MASFNPIPTLPGALWSGNAQLATKQDLKNLSTNNITNSSTINTSSLIAISVSSLFGDFNVNLVSSLQFNPSLGGLNIDLGMGSFLGGLLGSAGTGLFNTVLGGAALGTGIAALTMTRANNSISPNLNSNVFETINGTAQLQVSTIGSDLWSIQRVVSSIAPNQIPGREVFVSTLIPAGTTAIRTVSDPIYLANPSTLTSSIQSFGQWTSFATKPSTLTASNLFLNYSVDPAIYTSTTKISTIVSATPYTGSFFNFNSTSQPTKFSHFYSATNIFPSTSYNPFVSTIPGNTSENPYVPTTIPNFIVFKPTPLAGNCFVDATRISTAICDVDTTGTGALGFWIAAYLPNSANIVVRENQRKRVSWNWSNGTLQTFMTDIPLPQSTIITSNVATDAGIYQQPGLTYFSTNGSWAYSGNVVMSNDLNVIGTLNANFRTINTDTLTTSTIRSSSNITSFSTITGNTLIGLQEIQAPSIYGNFISGTQLNATSTLTAPTGNFGTLSTNVLTTNNLNVISTVFFDTVSAKNLNLVGLNISPSYSMLNLSDPNTPINQYGGFSYNLGLGNGFFTKNCLIINISWLIASGDVNNPTVGNFLLRGADGTGASNFTTFSTINFYVGQSGGDAFTTGNFQCPLFQGVHYASNTTQLYFELNSWSGRLIMYDRGGNTISAFSVL